MSKKAISKSNTPSRLFVKDELHIKRKVKNLGSINTSFKDNSSAVRYYVHLGIAYENRAIAAESVDDKIIKHSQSEVVRSELYPIKSTIDSLIKVIEKMSLENNSHFNEISKSQELAHIKLDALNDYLSTNLTLLIQLITKSEFINLHSLRNIIILRSILFVFLMAHRTERIEPHKIKDWQKVVKFAHLKAEELTDEELKHIESNTFETALVEDLATQLFAEMQRQKTISNNE